MCNKHICCIMPRTLALGLQLDGAHCILLIKASIHHLLCQWNKAVFQNLLHTLSICSLVEKHWHDYLKETGNCQSPMWWIKSNPACSFDEVKVLCWFIAEGESFGEILRSKFKSLLTSPCCTDVETGHITAVLLCLFPPGQKCYLLFVIWLVVL